MNTIPYVATQRTTRERIAVVPLPSSKPSPTAIAADAWFGLRAAVPLVLAWLLAEVFYSEMSFSGNVMAFAFTWLGIDWVWRAALRWGGHSLSEAAPADERANLPR